MEILVMKILERPEVVQRPRLNLEKPSRELGYSCKESQSPDSDSMWQAAVSFSIVFFVCMGRSEGS